MRGGAWGARVEEWLRMALSVSGGRSRAGRRGRLLPRRRVKVSMRFGEEKMVVNGVKKEVGRSTQEQ